MWEIKSTQHKNNKHPQTTTESKLKQHNKNAKRNQIQTNSHSNNSNNKQITMEIDCIIGHHWANTNNHTNTHNQSNQQQRISQRASTSKNNKTTNKEIYVHHDRILYYANNMFISQDIQSGRTEHYYQDTQIDGSSVQMVKFYPNGKDIIFLVLKKALDSHYISVLWLNSPKQNNLINYEKLNHGYTIKIPQSNPQHIKYIDICYHSQKKYLYLLSQTLQNQNTNKMQQMKEGKDTIQIIQIHDRSVKSRVVLPLQKLKISGNQIKNIKNTDNPIQMTQKKIVIGSDYKEFIIFGKQYFRYWKVNYHEKTINQSNNRNMQRALRFENILCIYFIDHKKAKLIESKQTKKLSGIDQNFQQDIIIVITGSQAIFALKNQILKRVQIPIDNLHKISNQQKQSTQLAIQKSLNQIYKTKFRMNTVSDLDEKSENRQSDCDMDYVKLNKNRKGQSIMSISNKYWVHKNVKKNNKQSDETRIQFSALTSNKKIYIYSISTQFEIKIEAVINTDDKVSFNQSTNEIKVSHNGTVLLVINQNDQFFLVHTNEQILELLPFYQEGVAHNSKIVSISSPQLNEIIVSTDKQGSLKIWNLSLKQKNKGLLLDFKPKQKPLNAIIHPSGLLVAVNFGNQIKVYGIVSSLLQQLAAIKTNDFCSSLSYCKINNFLISNEKSFIKLYEPFTLQCHHKIETIDLRLQIKSYQISQNGQFMVFQCCNQKVYRYSLANLINRPGTRKQAYQLNSTKNNSIKQNQQINTKSQVCHTQDSIYTCFQFDFGKCKNLDLFNKEKNLDFTYKEKQNELDQNEQNIPSKKLKQKKANIFLGFTETKYMVIYADYGERLVAEFPIVNCFIVDMCLENSLLFLGTSSGKIRVYNWPILEEHLEMEILNQNHQQIKARVKQPEYYQFFVWQDMQPVTCIHKISSTQKLVIGNKSGRLAIVNFQKRKNLTKNKNSSQILHRVNPIPTHTSSKQAQQQHQRNKLCQVMASLKYIKLSEQQRMNKLIEKTQNDIIKLHYEIARQKKHKMNELSKQKQQKICNYKKRAQIENIEYQQYHSSQMKEDKSLQIQYESRVQKIAKQKIQLTQISINKIQYEKGRLNDIKDEQAETRQKYQKLIKQASQNHRQQIKQLKISFRNKIKKLQQDFQNFVAHDLSHNTKETQGEIEQINFDINQKQMTMPAQLQQLLYRVQQLQIQLTSHQNTLKKLQNQNKECSTIDLGLQKQFEETLETYNKGRYDNLVMHSQVIKMQNQLLQRKQILQKKDQVISVIKFEKQASETFKALSAGNIEEVEQTKQIIYKQYMKKGQQLKALFIQLESQISKGQGQKIKIGDYKRMIKLHKKQVESKENMINQYRNKLVDTKRILLLEGLSDSVERKKIYHEQQKLLASIKWLEKRFKLTCINEKKIINLKNEGVEQVIKQNKNLLEECNQLRGQGIQYDNEIKHLSERLSEANRIIELERKMKLQKNDIHKQSMKLQQIRAIFSKQLNLLGVNDSQPMI